MFDMLRILYIWLPIYTVYTISFTQAYRTLYIGYTCNSTTEYSHLADITELGLSGMVDQIKINGKCYGKAQEPDADLCHERQNGNHTNVIKLDNDEFFNKVEYEWNHHKIYLSFSTNRNKTITVGNRSNESRYEGYPLSPHWGYGRLHSIKVHAIGLEPGEYIHWLYISYEYPDWVSHLKTTNVSFILNCADYPVTEYEDPNERIAHAYTLVYYKYKFKWSAIAKELITKIGDNFEIKEDDKGWEKIVKKNSSAKYNLRKTHKISKGQVGIKVAVGELLEGENQDWLFPTSVASYQMINISDVKKFLYHYDLYDHYSGLAGFKIPGLKSYTNKRRGLIYYTDSPGQEWRFNITSLEVNYLNISILYQNCFIKPGESVLKHYPHSVNDIRIDQVYAGGTGGFIHLDMNEYINEVIYNVIIADCDFYNATVEGDDTCEIVDYISFCTNKGKCTTNGANGTNGSHKKLENIRVSDIYTHHNVYNIHLRYIVNYQPSQLLATNVPFVLEFTPPSGVMTEYVNSFEKNVEIYSKTLKNVEKAKNESTIPYEIFFKIKDAFDYKSIIYMDKLRMFDDYIRILEQAPRLNLTTTKTIPPWHVGVKFATGELWRGANGTHWIYPKTMTRTSVIRVSNVIKLLGYYDLTGKLHTYVHNLKKYKKIQHGFVYYEKPNRTALFYFLDESKARRMHYLLLVTLITSITVTLSFKYWNVISKNMSKGGDKI